MTALPSGRSPAPAPQPLPGRVPGAVVAAVVAAAVWVLSSGSWWAFGETGASLWLAAGPVMVALVVLPDRSWRWVVAGAVVAAAVAGVGHGVPLGWAIVAGGVQVVEAAVAGLLFVRWHPRRSLGERRGFAAFLVAAMLLAPALGAVLAMTVLAARTGDATSTLAMGGYWWVSHAVGFLVVAAPALAVLVPGGPGRPRRRLEWLIGGLLLTALALLPVVAGPLPVTYLPFTVMVLAALRLGTAGPLLMGALYAVLVEGLTIRGYGAFAALVEVGGPALVYSKVFMVVITLTAWLLAVEVNEHERARLGEQAERSGRVAAERIAERLARLRVLSEALSRTTTAQDVSDTWSREAHGVLAGVHHELWVVDRETGLLTLLGVDRATAHPVGATLPTAVPDGPSTSWEPRVRALHDRAVVVAALPDGGSLVVAPIADGGEVVGVLAVEQSGAHDRGATETIAAAAARVGEAMARVRLFHESRQATARLARLQELTSRLGRQSTTEGIIRDAVEVLPATVGASAAGMLLADANGRVLRAAGGTGESPVGLGGADRVRVGDGSPIGDAAATRRAVRGPMAHPSVAPPREDVVVASWVVLPMVSAGTLRGVVWLAWSQPRLMSAEERAFQVALVQQCAVSLRRAAATEGEHEAAVKLQRALLPGGFPQIDGIAAAARYVPSSQSLAVGGDWYDVIPRQDGLGVIVVGDVVGHDVTAAAAMGRLRSATTAIAVAAEDPGEALDRLEAFPGGGDLGFATVLYADYDPADGALRYACAGHPPPLLMTPGGEARFLTDGRSMPLFALPPSPDVPRTPRSCVEVTVPRGSLLVCYTDGLVERRGRTLYDGMTRLARAALRHRGGSLRRFTDGILEAMTREERLRDDVALLCLRLDGPAVAVSPSGRPSAATAVRPARLPTRA